MSLQMIFGCAGSGKTWRVRKMAVELGSRGDPVLLVVPEQFVFETERALLEDAGPSFALHVDVLSFSRLAQHCTGCGLPMLDAGAKLLMVSIALGQVCDQFEFYGRQAKHPGFAKTASTALSSLRAAGLNPSSLRKLARQTAGDRLKAKLGDMALLMDAYDALTANRFEDTDNALQRLVLSLQKYNPYAGRTILLDSFKGFTEIEYGLISVLMGDASKTVISLPADRSAFEPNGRYKLFAGVASAALRIRALAAEMGISEEPPVFLEENHRFVSPDLAYAESAWRGNRRDDPPNPEHIRLISCTSPSREASLAAMYIQDMVRQKGLRYRDFMVILREPEQWKGVLDHALNQAGIPFFWGVRKSLAESPICKFLLHALDCVMEFTTDNLLKYLKTYLCGLTEDEIFQLENYIFLHPLAGRQWSSAWTEEIEPLRSRLILPLTSLRQALKSCDGASFAQALYQFLRSLDIPRRVEELDAFARDPRLEARVIDQRRSYNALISLLEQFADLTVDYYAPLLELTGLFSAMAESASLAEVPQLMDSVQVGGAELVRPGWGIRAVLILGANEGVFPAKIQESGPFTLLECRELSRLGSPVNRPLEEVVGNEKLLAYQALFSASEYLYLSCSDQNMASQPLAPSALITQMGLLFHDRLKPEREEYLPFLKRLSSVDSALAELRWAAPAEKTTLEAWMSRNGHQEKIDLIRAASTRSYQIAAPEGSRLLFGTEFKAYPSNLEKFAQCRFSFFCCYGLGARQEKPKEFNELEYGNALHYVLERMLNQYDSAGVCHMTNQVLSDTVRQLLEQYSPELFVEQASQDAKTAFFIGRMVQFAADAIRNICEGLLAGSFMPVAFELPVGESGGITPLTVEENGVRVSLTGKIDRVDQYTAPDGKRYIRIIDYKTGEIGFSEKKLQVGLNLQLVYYLDTLCRQQTGPFAGCLPAGILYVPLKETKPSLSAEAGDQEIRQARGKSLRMSGLVLDDPEIVEAMESGGGGKYIPVSLKADGSVNRAARSTLKNSEQFDSLFDLAEEQIRKMAKRVSEGDFWAYPLCFSTIDSPCRVCEYDAVCLRDAGDPVQSGDEEPSMEGGEQE